MTDWLAVTVLVVAIVGSNAAIWVRLSAISDELHRKFGDLNLAIGKLTGQFDGLEKRFTMMEARLDRIEARLDRIEARLADARVP